MISNTWNSICLSDLFLCCWFWSGNLLVWWVIIRLHFLDRLGWDSYFSDSIMDHNIISNEDMVRNRNDSVKAISIWLFCWEHYLPLSFCIKGFPLHELPVSNWD